MTIPEFMRVAKGGYTTLAGEIDHVARAGLAAVGRTVNALTTRVEAAESIVADGDKGDITVSSTGTVWTIDNGVVTAAKVAADVATQAELDAVSSAVATNTADIAALESEISPGGVTLNDDQAAFIDVAGANPFVYGIMMVAGNVPGAGVAVVHFRVGTTNSIDLLSSAGPVAVLATGSLSGTTGVDGNFTIAASSNGNLYAENRTAGVRAYDFSFLATSAPPASSTWTIV